MPLVCVYVLYICVVTACCGFLCRHGHWSSESICQPRLWGTVLFIHWTGMLILFVLLLLLLEVYYYTLFGLKLKQELITNSKICHFLLTFKYFSIWHMFSHL